MTDMTRRDFLKLTGAGARELEEVAARHVGHGGILLLARAAARAALSRSVDGLQKVTWSCR